MNMEKMRYAVESHRSVILPLTIVAAVVAKAH